MLPPRRHIIDYCYIWKYNLSYVQKAFNMNTDTNKCVMLKVLQSCANC